MLLIVTLLTFCSTYALYGHTVHSAVLKVIVELLINAVELVIRKLNLGFAVTVHAPSHTEIGELLHFTHFLYLAVTSLTGYLSGIHVL